MKIKRYFAQDIRRAIKSVRDELGSEAVILSNKRVDGGVEIVAAIDYDEEIFNNTVGVKKSDPAGSAMAPSRKFDNSPSAVAYDAAPIDREFATKQHVRDIVWSQDPAIVAMRDEIKSLRFLLENQMSGLAWTDLNRNSPAQAELMRRLNKLGFSENICSDVLHRLSNSASSEISGHSDADTLWRHTLAAITTQIPVSHQDDIERGGIVALVGATGVGKTTTAAKMAAQYALSNSRRDVALVTIDNYRVAAYEQLKMYGRIIDIPVKVAESRKDLAAVLSDLSDKSFIIVDTAGMAQNDEKLCEQIDVLSQSEFNIRKTLVLSATVQLSGLRDIVKGFSKYAPDQCVVTKLDECTSLGGIISVIIENRLPLVSISDGQRVPEDLHKANAHTLVGKSVVLGDKVKEREGVMTRIKLGRVAADAYL